MYGASAHWPYGNFSGTDAAGWNGVEGGGENDGQFDVQTSNASFPSISTPSPWPSAPSHNAAPSFGSSAHSDASHAGSMTFPDAFAQSIPYQPHHDGYHLAFGTELGANLSRAQYGEPLNYPLQLAALEQQLDFLTEPSMHPKQSTHDPWVDFIEYVVFYGWLVLRTLRLLPLYITQMTNALLPVPVARHRIRTLRNLIHFLKSVEWLARGKPAQVRPTPISSDVSNPSPVPVDISSINNLFEDCEWRRSDTIWLDDGIWSQYITFGKGVSLTSGKLVERLEQVHGGIPTELPHLSVPTAFILTAPDSARVDGMTMESESDNLFRSGCPHSFGGSTGKPSGDTSILGLFFPGQDPKTKINVRRAVPTCRGGERRELDPNAKQKLAQAQLRTRELQGTSRVGQVFTFMSAMECFYCRGVLTVLRFWMESHDRLTFKDVGVQILRLISTLTSHRLRFKNLHPGGTLLGLLSDMEAAPLLGFTDAVWDTLTAARQAEIGTPIAMLSYVLRICHVHFDRGVDSDHLKDLSSADREKVRSLKDCTSHEAFEEWKQAVSLFFAAWWRQKEMHLFLLPGLIQALSNIDLDDWHLMPANTNVGEGQHRWNNIQTGVSMGVIESMKKYEAAEANSNSSGRVPLPRAQTRTATATVFPAATNVPIPYAGTPDPLQPISAAELSEAPIRELRKCARAHNPSAPSLQPGKSQKRAKKCGEKELNLDWELVAGGKRWWARDLARENPEEFKLEWPAYAHLVDTL
ncbi:hypothetical protein B0H13DRAFT_2569863 [Mycena leptocephala]|nr:hypothetical protein B0H13DRAFT_2569863 [Mycena leptocephala]